MTTRSTDQERKFPPGRGRREHVRAPYARWALTALALVLGYLSPAWGQALSDPTRPPQAFIPGAQKAPGAPAAEQEVLPQIQSLLLGPSRRYAIIGGQILGVGDTFRDARVVAVTPAGVVLRSEQGTRTLKLFPDVEKRPVKPLAADVTRAPAKAKRLVRVTGPDNNVAKEKK
jgi:hypothetical protein